MSSNRKKNKKNNNSNNNQTNTKDFNNRNNNIDNTNENSNKDTNTNNSKKSNNRNNQNQNKKDQKTTGLKEKDLKNRKFSKDEPDECDKILEQLDQMEQGKGDISSKVKNLIKSDKEAIRKMQEEMKQLEDDLDYLDDEKPEEPYSSDMEIEDDDLDDLDRKAKSKVAKDAEMQNESDSLEDEDEDEVNLDFFAKLERDDQREYNRIRKQQPKRLHAGTGGNRRPQGGQADNRKKYMIVASLIAVLFIGLVVALALDAKNAEKADSKSVHTEFLDMDTTPMMDAIDNYYNALAQEDTTLVRSYLVDSEKVSDEEIAKKSEETKMYAELISSSFEITDCYVQQGLKKNEYIAYMKFQLQLKSIETPAVGIFTCYFVAETTDGKTEYKISTNVNDKSSDVYKYIIKMKNCDNVTDLFEQVDKELAEACEKDENLKAVVDALGETETTTDNEPQTNVDDSTTEPIEIGS